MNRSRLRHTESSVYASATRSGSRVFQASSAAWTFWRAVSSVNGGNGGRGAMAASLCSWRSADLSVLPGPVRGPQHPLEDLAGTGPGDLLGERYGPRRLVAGQVHPAERHDVLLRQRCAGTRHHGGMDRLAPLLRRDPEHRGLVHVRVLLEHGLDLGRVDVHPAGDDHVVLPVADVVIPLVVAVGDVPDRVEVAAPPGLVALLALVVLVEHDARADVELAGMIGPGAGHLLARGVEQAELDAGRGLAARARLP